MIKITKDLLTKLGVVKETKPDKSHTEKLAEMGEEWGTECKLLITRGSDSLVDYMERVNKLEKALRELKRKVTIVRDIGVTLLKIQVKNKDTKRMLEIVQQYKHGKRDVK